MQKQALVSIIIPTYNRAHLIGETLDSVLAQTYTNWECIIVDDGSSDNTDEVVGAYVKKDNRFKYYHRPDEHLPGGNGARNFGFKMSRGEYVNWFDSDDMMHPKKLEIQIDLLINTDKNFCVCQTMIFENDIKNELGLRKKNIHSDDPFNDFVQSKIKWLTQAPILKTDFIKKNNLIFNEDLKRSQEFEFFARVLFLEKDYCYTNQVLVYLRSHDNRISQKNYSPEKNISTFKASYHILNDLKSKLNTESIKHLKNNLIRFIFIALEHKDFRNASILIHNFKQLNRKLRLLVLYFSLISYKLTNRGYFFYKLIKYA